MSAQLFREAERAFQGGDLGRADELCSQSLAADPNDAPATLLRGLIAARRSDFDAAIGWLKKALVLSPNDYVAYLWLPIALRDAGRHLESIQVGEQARALWPTDPEILANLALGYYSLNDFKHCEERLLEALRFQPRNLALSLKLGSLYERLGREEEAAKAYSAAINVAPGSEDGYVKLVRLLISHGNYKQAIERCEAGLRIIPRSARIHLTLAQALRGVQEMELAEEHLRKAIALDSRIILAAALWLNEDGRFEDAAALFRDSISQRPEQGTAYYGLLIGRKVTEADRPLLEEMRDLAKRPSLAIREKAALHYGLGKASNDLGEYEMAMKHFDAGNALKYQVFLEGKGFGSEEFGAAARKTEAMFTRDFMERHRSLGSESDLPIFVISMIRSGTTLLEQIIASHPEVGGAGEQRFWGSEYPRIVDLDAQTFNEDRFSMARDRYLQVLRGLQPEARRITDKMPMNYVCAGLLHLAYPKSPILHIRRRSIDTALSIYMTDLASPPEFAHNKRNIVKALREYELVMDHWRQVLPSKSFMEVQYEDLVADQEVWTRKILEFCGLEWSDSCLEFHKHERKVSTPSLWQVRQPIYRDSVDKWRRYEPWLGEFAELLPQTSPEN
jgi:tetratricopeptide (TPR) repeat protein